MGRPAGGFTILELMVSTLITAIVFSAVISAYVFLGRSLIRVGNADSLESGARRTLYYFRQDAATATAVTTAGASQVTLSTPNGTVSYTYDSVGQTLTRVNTSGTLALLSGVTTCKFDYYDSSQTATTTPAVVKLVDFVATTTNGTLASGSESHFSFASPRMVLRNKPFLQ